MSTESELVTPLNHQLWCLMRGDEEDDDTARLSELIALAEAGLPVEEAEDDTGRLSELIAQVEAGSQAVYTKIWEEERRNSKLPRLCHQGIDYIRIDIS